VAGLGPAAALAVAPAASFVPHVPQNLWPGGFVAPQVGQPDASVDPQLPQTRGSALATVPHAAQVISFTARS
jgi:hypothetical protein